MATATMSFDPAACGDQRQAFGGRAAQGRNKFAPLVIGTQPVQTQLNGVREASCLQELTHRLRRGGSSNNGTEALCESRSLSSGGRHMIENKRYNTDVSNL